MGRSEWLGAGPAPGSSLKVLPGPGVPGLDVAGSGLVCCSFEKSQ